MYKVILTSKSKCNAVEIHFFCHGMSLINSSNSLFSHNTPKKLTAVDYRLLTNPLSVVCLIAEGSQLAKEPILDILVGLILVY